jgi:alpha-beta hydrolase superfamily lysophospholipase
MEHVEGSFKGVRNADIYQQAWLPDEEAKAVVLVVHGLGEHSGRYMNVVNAVVPRGYAVYALDHIGHGKSEGGREVVERFEDYTDTLTIYLTRVKDQQAGKPVFLLGHSMGGLIASTYLLDHQDAFGGAVISAPAVRIGDNVSKGTILMSKVLSAVAPKMGVLALDAAGISRDPEVVQAYVDDPLVFHGKTPARLAAEMLKAMMRVTAEAGTIHLPILIVQGSEDSLVDPGGAQMLYDTVSSPDKTLKVYEGFFHEVCNEPECALVLEDIGAWLDGHV